MPWPVHFVRPMLCQARAYRAGKAWAASGGHYIQVIGKTPSGVRSTVAIFGAVPPAVGLHLLCRYMSFVAIVSVKLFTMAPLQRDLVQAMAIEASRVGPNSAQRLSWRAW